MNKSINTPLSYRLEVSVTPNWNQIMRWYFPKLKTDGDVSEFISGFAKKYKIDKDESLYGKRFFFLEFYDGVSGLNMIWSPKYKELLYDLEDMGEILGDKEGKISEELCQHCQYHKSCLSLVFAG